MVEPLVTEPQVAEPQASAWVFVRHRVVVASQVMLFEQPPHERNPPQPFG